MKSWILIVALLAGCGGTSALPFEGHYVNGALAIDISLTQRTQSFAGTPGHTDTLPVVMTTVTSPIADFDITNLDGKYYEHLALTLETGAYTGGVSAPGAALDGRPDGFLDFQLDMHGPGVDPAQPSATTNYTVVGKGTTSLVGAALSVTFTGMAVRTFSGTVGVDFPDGLFEVGTGQAVLTAQRMP